MKLNSICSVKTLCITLISVYFSSVNAGIPGARNFGRGLNAIGNYGGRGGGLGRMVRYIPIPIVKRVTHHHIHHIISAKGKGKYGGNGGDDGYDAGLKGANGYGQLGNEDNKYSNGYGQLDNEDNKYTNGYGQLSNENNKYTNKVGVDKRGGRFAEDFGAYNKGVGIRSGNRGDSYSGNSFRGGNSGGIEGFIGDTKAEFVPVVIGLIDDEVKDFPLQKRGGRYSNVPERGYRENEGFGTRFSDYEESFGHGYDSNWFGNEAFGVGNRQYSSRKGLLRPSNTKSEYIPPPETVKLFEDLAKMGW